MRPDASAVKTENAAAKKNGAETLSSRKRLFFYKTD